MQKLYFLLILSVGMAAGGAVCGQDGVPNRSWKPVIPMRPWKPVMPTRPWTPVMPGDDPTSRKLELLRSAIRVADPVRIMSPDRMPCMVPSMAMVERMPVKILLNRFPVDPLRNGIAPK